MSSTTKNDINDGVMRRLEKLFRLQQSSNEHEAATAAARAAELMLKYQIDAAQLRIETPADEPIIDEPIVEGVTRHWHATIAWGVAAGYGGRCYGWQIGRTRFVNFIGTAEACNAARYTTQYLCAEVRRLALQAFAGSATEQHSFCIGAALVISRRMTESRQAAVTTAAADANTSQALAIIKDDDKRIDERFAKLNMKNRTVRSTYSSRDAFADGQRAGEAIQLRGGAALTVATSQLKGT